MQRKIHISMPSFSEEEWAALKEPLESGWVTQGPKVKEFEKNFSVLHGVKHAYAVTSATTALHISLHALGVGAGDEVIVPAFTWVATANAVLFCGAAPVFADIDPVTFNMDPGSLKKKVTRRTKAIIPVHLFGLCADMDELKNAAPGIRMVEDAACAAGAKYKGRYAGGLGEMGCFSFHPRKSITTGEGGMVTTNDDELGTRVDMLRNHGASVSEEQRHDGPKPYILPEFNMMGFNYRMTDLQGALGVVQLSKLEKFIGERNSWAGYYNKELREIAWLRTPEVPENWRHGWQAYVVMVDEAKAPAGRNEIMERLEKKGISTRPGTHAVHMLGYYAKKYGIKPGDYPGAMEANNRSMAIPLHNRMSQEDYSYIVETIKSL